MRQVVRKGLKHIIVDEVPDPVLRPGHVVVQPQYSLISSGTETASIHRGSLLKTVAEKPSHLETIWRAATTIGPLKTLSEVRAKFGEYAVLGYAGAGVIVSSAVPLTWPSDVTEAVGGRVDADGDRVAVYGPFLQGGRRDDG